MYGVEPVVELVTEIDRRLKKMNLPFEYRTMLCGAEEASLYPALSKEGLIKSGRSVEIFDTIVCIRVLCSVPHPQKTIDGLYALLKPGGKMLIVEHVCNPWTKKTGSILARIMQSVYTFLGWSYFIGECRLTRDTESMLIAAAKKNGGWAKSDIQGHFERTAMPHICGTLAKKGNA